MIKIRQGTELNHFARWRVGGVVPTSCCEVGIKVVFPCEDLEVVTLGILCLGKLVGPMVVGELFPSIESQGMGDGFDGG